MTTPEERAEKVVMKYSGQYSLIAAKEDIVTQIHEAVEEALLNSPTVSKFAYDKAVKEAYEDAAKIARDHDCIRCPDICGMSIAEQIRARAKETK